MLMFMINVHWRTQRGGHEVPTQLTFRKSYNFAQENFENCTLFCFIFYGGICAQTLIQGFYPWNSLEYFHPQTPWKTFGNFLEPPREPTPL